MYIRNSDSLQRQKTPRYYECFKLYSLYAHIHTHTQTLNTHLEIRHIQQMCCENLVLNITNRVSNYVT